MTQVLRITGSTCCWRRQGRIRRFNLSCGLA